MKWQLKEPKAGDMIRVKVGTIYHVGIYVSDEEVIQFGLAPSQRLDVKDSDIEVLSSDIDAFLCGGFLEVAQFDWLESGKNRKPQEVVDYAISRDLFVILNINHDTDKQFVYPDSKHYEQSEKYITSIWQQVSERFKDYDSKLIFECINETRLAGTNVEWWFNTADARIVDAADCINRLNQSFVNTVRAAGGSNTDRYLMLSGYAASPDGTKTDFFTLLKNTHKMVVFFSSYLCIRVNLKHICCDERNFYYTA
jgi:hypothetical protein